MNKFCAIGAALLLLAAAGPGDSQTPKGNMSALEMVFVLDTTGSMQGMIDGAKQKIWSIVNDVLKSSSPPRVKIGLVAYRDHGDAYVTQILPLTGDLDKVYSTLMTYKADGGGDTPEDVRRALAEGVHKAGWSARSPHLAQALFLVGDAPPHDDYKREPDTCFSAHQAAQAGISVNAIQCGEAPDTKAAWERIVRCGKGDYFRIAEDGGIAATPPTPFDAALDDLGTVLGGTYLPYVDAGGAAAARKQQVIEAKMARESPKPALADRAVNKALNRDAYSHDLLQLLQNGSLTLDTLQPGRLPLSLRRLSPDNRRRALERALANRKSVQVEILALARRRDAYLGRADGAQDAGPGQKGLDEAILAALRRQAKPKGIIF